jgi:hypothetical protein
MYVQQYIQHLHSGSLYPDTCMAGTQIRTQFYLARRSRLCSQTFSRSSRAWAYVRRQARTKVSVRLGHAVQAWQRQSVVLKLAQQVK